MASQLIAHAAMIGSSDKRSRFACASLLFGDLLLFFYTLVIPGCWLFPVMRFQQLALGLPPLAIARPYCGDSCFSSISSLDFEGCRDAIPTDKVSILRCHCASPAFVESIALCIEEHCASDPSAWAPAYHSCAVRAGVPISGLEEALISAKQHEAIPFIDNATIPVYQPVSISTSTFEPADKSVYAFKHNLDIAVSTGLLLVALATLVCLLIPLRSILPSPTWAPFKHLIFSIKKYLYIPALNRKNAVKGQIGRFTLSYPTRLQTVLLAIYLGINVVGPFVNLNLFKENEFWPDNLWAQGLRYVSDRSGILAFANMPLMVAFGGRNHILMWLSGSRFDDFNVFHKWIGRMVVWHSLLHTMGYTILFLQNGGIEHLWHAIVSRGYLQFGLIAFLAGVVICVQGAHVFRRWKYELFLYLHIALSIAFLIGAWYHVGLLKLHRFMPWVYASCFFWLFDRVARVFRLLYYNVGWNSKDGMSFSTARFTCQGDYVQIEIYPARHWNFKPGQYVYFHLLDSRFWESHPFSIVAHNSASKVDGSRSAKFCLEDDEEEGKTLLPAEERRILLYVRPFDGMTRRLAAIASAQPSTLHNVLIEGPYGHQIQLSSYDRTCFMAGGIGISGVFALFQEACARGWAELFWVVRDLLDLRCCLDDLASNYASGQVTIWVRHGSTSSVSAEDAELLQAVQRSNIKLYVGIERPSCQALIEEQQAKLAAGQSLAIVCCGPPAMTDDCRAACAQLTTLDRQVDYFSENLNW